MACFKLQQEGCKLESRKYRPMGEYLRQVTKTAKEPSLEGTRGKRVSLQLGAGDFKGVKIHGGLAMPALLRTCHLNSVC